MIGNDIVDLQIASQESNWRRKGYLDKIYTKQEQSLITFANHPDKTVWILWSMKEAAYKIINRHTLNRFYQPKDLQCEIISTETSKYTGIVTYNDQIFYTQTEVTNNYVHTSALMKPSGFNQLHYSIKKETTTPTLQKDLFGIPFIPLTCNKTKPVSVSHHGKYLSIVYPK